MKINGDFIELGDRRNEKINNDYINNNEIKPLVNENVVNNESQNNKFQYIFSNENRLKIVSFFIIFLEVVLYIFSLEGCHETQTFCLVNLSPQYIHRLLIYVCISSLLFSLIIYLTINNTIKAYFIFLQIIIFSYLMLEYDVGSDLAYHGSYNRSLFVTMVPVFLCGQYMIKFLYHLFNRKYFKLISFIIISFFSLT